MLPRTRRHELATELTLALRALAPADVRVGWRAVDDVDVAGLFEVEAAHVRRAVPRRRREFASGRALLRELIGSAVPIPVAPDRSPVLPDHVRGSLAHDDELAVAAVTTDPSVLAIGIDVEPATPLEPAVAALVLRSDEQGIDPHLAFTAKEAAYKAWSGRGGRTLEHHDVRLSVRDRRFRAEVPASQTDVEGAFVVAAGRWIALVVVREDRASGR